MYAGEAVSVWKHESTHSPADSVRFCALNNVVEAGKLYWIAIGCWVFTLRLLGAEIGG